MERVTIDRIIDGVAICLAGPGMLRRIPADELPEGAGEGTVLDRVDGAYVINAELTAGQTTYMESELYYEHEDGSPAMRDDFEGRL